MTPVGYQTNLFVYGPGGYRFVDYLRVGGPLQATFAVVTTLGIRAIWGVTPPTRPTPCASIPGPRGVHAGGVEPR